jgi:phage terminase large subunit-like protein
VTSTPRLSEYARCFRFPDGIHKTVWPRVEAKGSEIGLNFDWWQAQLGAVCLGYREDGKYAATIGGVGLSIPRQVGKTYFVMALVVIMCILFPGLQVVWTSHHLRTTTRTLTAIQGMSRRKKIMPHVKTVRTSHGEGQVEFTNGSIIMFGARSQGFGRGFDVIDIEVFDEAQILDAKALEDMVAATNQSQHQHGALLFFMGTPPRPSDPSDAYRQRRDEALTGDDAHSIWLEIGADPESEPDDELQWGLMNPSYPDRTPRESILRLRKNLKDDDSWNREGRGIWDPKNRHVVIDPQSWALTADASGVAASRLAIGIEVAPDRSVASIAVAGERADGLWHVELDEHRSGTGWIVPWVKARCQRNEIRAVVIDTLSPAASLLDEFKAAKIKVTTTTGTELANACGQFYDGVMNASIRHTDQPQVNVALSAVGKRPLGDRWVWNRKTPNADITPIVAETLALWGSQTGTVKRPGTGERRTGTRRALVL